MKSQIKSRAICHTEATLSAEVMAMAASLAGEIGEKWPFAAAHLRVDVFGAVGHSNLQTAIGRAITLGLSGIVDGASDARKTAGVFALQQRMMAVRLAGRKLTAFHPDRDLNFILTRRGGLADRVRVTVRSNDGALIGQVEQAAGFDGRDLVPRAACA